MRRPPVHRDENQRHAVEALWRAGYRVQDTSGVGGGFPDLLVGTPWNSLALLEFKNPDRRWELLPSQFEWHRHWHRFPIFVATSGEHAIRLMAARHERGKL